jgi:hypothetical protein
MRINLIRKPGSGDLYGEEFIAERVIRVDSLEFHRFLQNPMASRPEWFSGFHKVLVQCEDGGGLIAVSTEGADYARYAARIR